MPCKDYSDLSRTQLLEILRELKGMLRDHEKAPSPRPAALGPSRLGIGIYPDHDRDPSVLIRLPEKAMRDAKQAGRNTDRLYPPKVGRAFRRAECPAQKPLTTPESRV